MEQRKGADRLSPIYQIAMTRVTNQTGWVAKCNTTTALGKKICDSLEAVPEK
ncbi:hypothetical protein [Candidatus Avelusimicrobium sp.]